MSDHTTIIKQLLTELSSDVTRYQTLRALLKEQAAYLTQRQTQSLMAINQQLAPLLMELNSHAQQRCQYLRTLGVSANNDGMQKLLSVLPQQYQEKGKLWWASLHQLTLECDQLNRENGQRLAQHKQMLDKLLRPEQQYTYAPHA